MSTTAEKIAVMQAYERGEKVEFHHKTQPPDMWSTITISEPAWDWSDFSYRIAKSEPKVVKLLAWLAETQLIWLVAGTPTASGWKRVPSEDKTIEVEE